MNNPSMESGRPLTAEEEAVKRNTDCVYFLASPLTCKKGNECEFRHSEVARVNPRDCWFWLNGNCRNPKCQFRHPPLDGLFGIPGTPSGPSPSSVAHVPPGPYNPSKQSVPCYYFQKGQCLKGDMCPFMHGPPHPPQQQQSTNGPHHPVSSLDHPNQFTSNALDPSVNCIPQHVVAKHSTSFTGTSQTNSWAPKQQHIHRANFFDKPVDVPLHSFAKSSINKGEGVLVPKRSTPSPLRYQPNVVAPVSSGNTTPSRPNHHHQPPQPAEDEENYHPNDREADEFLGESSPGFDVLVDDDVGDSEYYHNEEDFGRNLNPSINDFDFDYHHHPTDYEAIGPSFDFERDQYDWKEGELDRYGQAGRQYNGSRDRRQRDSSSERAMERNKRRGSHRELSPDEMDGSDLRHRLLKKQRQGLNGFRSSAVRPEYRGERRRSVEYRRLDRSVGQDQPLVPSERSFSHRLQGRITLPARSPPHQPREMQSERDRDSGRRPINYRGRPLDRIKQAPTEEFVTDERSFKNRASARDVDGDPLNFTGPKSLAELKGAKVSGSSSQEQPTKRLDAPLAAGYQASEVSLSFEGPKPLSDILKRKRGSVSGNGSVLSSGDDEINYEKNSTEGFVDSASEKPKSHANNEEEEKGLTPSQDDAARGKLHEGEDQENFDQGDGYSDYDANDGENFNNEDDKNIDQEYENAYQEDDEDDEDDFAKKVGVFFS